MARVAVASGTATAVSNRVARRQANRWSAQGELPPPGYQQVPTGYEQAPPAYEQAPPGPAAASPIDQLRELGALHEQGVLTDEEFAAQKAKLLG